MFCLGDDQSKPPNQHNHIFVHFHNIRIDVKKAAEHLESSIRIIVNGDEQTQLPANCFLVIAFDESHTLATLRGKYLWTMFSEIRSILRIIRDHPIFSIFLSTAGKFQLLSPEPSIEPSARLSRQLLALLPPLVECPLDLFAKKVCMHSTQSIAEVASTEHMAYLGRPL